MGESSNHTPKPLLTYKGKTLTHHKLDALSDAFDEIIFVVGHLGEKFEEILGREYTLSSGKKVPLTYMWQKELLGTAHALHQAKEAISNSPFVVLMGDDLYSGEDIDKMIQHYNASGQWSVLLENSQTPMSAGKCLVNNLGNLIDIVEDPEATIPINKMYTGGCLLTPEIFNSKMVQLPNSVEYGLPQTFVSVAKNNKQTIKAFDATFWKRITSPEDLVE